MLRRTPSASVVVLGLLLTGCASAPTPYQAAQGGFGYSEQQIEENRYRVSFAGNSATSRQTVEDYLLYRAAELTVQNGHDWFEVVDRNTVQDYAGYGGSPSFGVGVGGGSNFGVGLSMPMFSGGGSGRYTADMDVLLRDGEKPQENPNAYDAFSVISRLQPKILTGGA
jgi:outer membrane protein TolC